MKLVVISHKEIWNDSTEPSRWVTAGGFPFQIKAISELFDKTTLIAANRESAIPKGVVPLRGNNLSVEAVPEPRGSGFIRKLRLFCWIPRHLPVMWNKFRGSDAIHALVPGDIGLIGILLALAQRKPLFVRHCGTWGEPVTIADRFLLWLLERIAGGRNVVMATGGSESLPSKKNAGINWIFSTSISQAEISSLPAAQFWQPGGMLRLITVGRLTEKKNAAAIINALPLIIEQYRDVRLDVVGEGPYRGKLEELVEEQSLQDFVRFYGNVSHEMVLDIFSKAHIFVFPTMVKEGFPKAVIEAMACGLPVIATRVSVIPHLLNKGCGILLKDTGPQSVADAVSSLCADPKKMRDMGYSARQTALNYTLEGWSDIIRERLQTAWNAHLRKVEVK